MWTNTCCTITSRGDSFWFAHGGPRGARLSLSLVGSEKLDAISGPDHPSSVRFIPPGQKLEFAIEYEGLLPSAAVNDIVASATLIEEETDARHFASNAVTSVSLEIEPIVERTGAQKRHIMGVRSDDVSDVEGTIDATYHQVFTIDEQGGLRIDKFGQWIFCSAGGEISHSAGIR